MEFPKNRELSIFEYITFLCNIFCGYCWSWVAQKSNIRLRFFHKCNISPTFCYFFWTNDIQISAKKQYHNNAKKQYHNNAIMQYRKNAITDPQRGRFCVLRFAFCVLWFAFCVLWFAFCVIWNLRQNKIQKLGLILHVINKIQTDIIFFAQSQLQAIPQENLHNKSDTILILLF